MRATPGDRSLGRERAPAGNDDDVGLCHTKDTHDARCHGIVVPDHAAGARHGDTAEKRAAVLRLHGPRAVCNGAGGIHDGELELGPLREPVEQRRPVRSWLRRYDRYPESAVLPCSARERATNLEPFRDHLRRKPRCDLAHLTEQPRSPESPRGRAADVAVLAVPALELGEQRKQRLPGFGSRVTRNTTRASEPPGEIGFLRGQRRGDSRDLAQGDLTLERLLQLRTTE